MSTEEIIGKLTGIAIEYGPKLLGAIVVWLLGSWVIKVLTSAFGKVMDKTKTDQSLKPFLKGLINLALKIMLVISVLGMLGIEMTSFIALLGAAGLAIGMALSGMLQNFAGGVVILLFKPYKVGDYIEAQGFEGYVHEIQIFNTILKTNDNLTVVLPNGGMSTSTLRNCSTEPSRRIEWIFGIAYGDSVDKAREVIKGLCAEDSRILKEPEPTVNLMELADSSVNLTVRAYIVQEDYWGVYLDLNENVYKAFGKEGLNIPFPQMDVHLHKNE